MKQLKVYGYRGHRQECPAANNGSKQTREIVAVTSVAAAHRAYVASGLYGTIGDVRNYGGWTGNEVELEVALAEPGVVFWANGNNRGSPQKADYTRAPAKVKP